LRRAYPVHAHHQFDRRTKKGNDMYTFDRRTKKGNDMYTSTLELPNGSAVVVVERPLAKVHERSV
jgi:hypothetical protein